MDVFDRYAPFVQDFIYEHGWESLRGVQVAAAEAIFNTDENVLLTASTASGKTEAAFFPILTEFWENPPSTVGAIYIGPLKALINDQFLRLDDLCAEAGINVWRWHGDVSPSHKNRMLKHPSGILQITPESLEALLLHKHAAIASLFGDLRYVVIDEVHSLLRGDRGGQCLACIERLSRLAGVKPRRIGLSATIGDPEATGRYLSAGTGRGCVIPRVEATGQRWRISMEHYYITGLQAPDRLQPSKEEALLTLTDVEASYEMPDQPPADQPIPSRDNLPTEADATALSKPDPEVASDQAPVWADPGVGYIFEHTRGRKCLVFCNSREEDEDVTTTLRQSC